MRLLLITFFLYTFASAGTPAEDWLPGEYKRGAVKYYDALDSLQWVDVDWHVERHGIRNAVYAGMEGSNRPRGKHPTEPSYQCVGINYHAAKLYRSIDGLRDSLRIHEYASKLAAEIDSANLAGHRKRYLENNHQWRAKRPTLNATMAYPGGNEWRSRLIYGMVHEARCRELEKRLLLSQKKVKL